MFSWNTITLVNSAALISTDRSLVLSNSSSSRLRSSGASTMLCLHMFKPIPFFSPASNVLLGGVWRLCSWPWASSAGLARSISVRDAASLLRLTSTTTASVVHAPAPAEPTDAAPVGVTLMLPSSAQILFVWPKMKRSFFLCPKTPSSKDRKLAKL